MWQALSDFGVEAVVILIAFGLFSCIVGIKIGCRKCGHRYYNYEDCCPHCGEPYFCGPDKCANCGQPMKRGMNACPACGEKNFTEPDGFGGKE